MADFIAAALPLVLVGLILAICAARFSTSGKDGHGRKDR